MEALPSTVALWRLPTVIEKTTLSQATIYRLMREGGKFPHPIKVGARAVAWRSDEVEAYLNSRLRSTAGDMAAFYSADAVVNHAA